jgi:tetratricopeptide (TPR) repeat protein
MAIKLLKQGLRRNPRNIRLYTALAYAYRMRRDSPRALECYKEILEIDSLHTPTLNRIGILYCDQGHYDQAIAYHRRALNIRPNDATAYKYIGQAYSKWGKYDKAIQSFIRSTNLCTTDPETYMYLAELYGNQKKGERKQQSAYKKAARLGNKEAQAWLVKNGLGW